ncbi:MAG: glycosyltransferase family 1 protein [Candidatus Sumerlaeota bacterium]|nr:glycosyltransferase family 1 protein [Candidatus Sumerlaeota bacterium]
MRICFDARPIRAKMTGIGVFSSRLLREMLAASSGHEWTLPHLPGAPLNEYKGRPGIQCVETRADYGDHPSGEWWLNVTLPGLLNRSRADLFCGSTYLVPWRRTRAKKIVIVYDLICFRRPESFPARFAWYMRAVTRLSARAADGIIAISRCTAKDLTQLCGVPESKIRVIYGAPDFALKPPSSQAIESARQRYGLRDPYLLCVGTLEPRKGALAAIRVLEQLREGLKGGARGSVSATRNSQPGTRNSELGTRNWMLVWAGNIGWRSEPLVRALESSPERVNIVRLDYVPDEHLAALYGGAEALLYLSDYEGFGLPPLEAMACGCPVISSNRASLPEAVGGGGILLAPEDTQGAVDILERWGRDRAARSEMIERGFKQAERFSWKKAAEETLRYFDEICAR